MEILIKIEQLPVLDSIFELLQEFNEEEQKEINSFLQGAKFVKNKQMTERITA